MEDVYGAYLVAFLSVFATLTAYLGFDAYILAQSTSTAVRLVVYVITGVLVFTIIPSTYLWQRGKLQFTPD